MSTIPEEDLDGGPKIRLSVSIGWWVPCHCPAFTKKPLTVTDPPSFLVAHRAGAQSVHHQELMSGHNPKIFPDGGSYVTLRDPPSQPKAGQEIYLDCGDPT